MSNKDNLTIFNPYNRVAGGRALGIGTGFVLVGVVLGNVFNARFDGVLNLHYVLNTSFQQVLMDQLINAFSLIIIFFPLGRWLGARHTRLLDIAGTMLLAMAPMSILPLLNIGGHWSEMAREVKVSPDAATRVLENIDPTLLILTIVAGLFILIWHVALLYNAYKISAHIKGNRLIYSFIIGLIAAVILSKYLLTLVPSF